MTQFMTPDEIQKTAEQLKIAYDAGLITAQQFKDGMNDCTKGVRNYTAKMNESLNQLGTSMKGLAEGMFKGETGMSQYNSAVTAGGDAAANMLMQFGPLGMAIGALIKIVTFGISQVNEMADGLYKANQDLAKTGAAGKEGMTGVFNNMQKFGYGIKELDQMTELIGHNSMSLAQFGGSVEQGTNQLANAAKGIKNSDLQRQFMNMGLSVNDINKGIASYVNLQSSLGIQSTETTEELTAHAADYIMQQDRLTKLTGQSAEQLQNNQAEAQQVEAWNAKLASMRPEEAKKYQAAYDMMRSTSKTAALGFAASVTGMTGMTKESAAAFQMTGGAIGALTKQYEANIAAGMDSTEAAAQFKQGMANAAAKTTGLANSVAMVGGNAGMGGIIEHNKLAALAGGKVIDSLNKVEDAQDDQRKGADKLTDEHTKLLQQQMETRDSFQTLVSKGIGPVTEGFRSMAKFINKLFHTGKDIDAEAEAANDTSSGSSGGSSSSGGASGPGAGSSASAGTAMDFFQSKGYSKEQSAGIVGNLQAESGKNLDTRALGDSGKAHGIAQWHPDRQAKFESMFHKKVRDATLQEQLEFVDWELKNTEKAAGRAVRNAKTAEEAAAAIDKLYERSSGTMLNQRIANAKTLLGGGTPTNTAPATAKSGFTTTDLASAQKNMPTANKPESTARPGSKGGLTPYQQKQLEQSKQIAAGVKDFTKAIHTPAS